MNRLQIREGESRTIELKNTNLSAIRLDTVFPEGTIDPSTVDYSKIQIDVTFRQFGKTVTIASGSLLTYMLYFAKYYGVSYMRPLNDTFRGFTMKNSASDSTFSHFHPFSIPFQNVLNLDNKDGEDALLTVKVSTSKDTLGGGYLQFSATKGIGVQKFVPQYKILSLPRSQVNFSEHLGENITDIVFLNSDISTYGASLKVFERVNVYSDKISEDYEFEEIALSYIDSEPLAKLSQHEYYPIHDDLELDDVKIDMTVNPDAVNGKQFIVYTSLTSSQKVLRKANDKEQKHYSQNMKKISSLN